MSSCIKDLFDYDLVKKCSKCGIVKLKSNFRKNRKSSDGLNLNCKVCRKNYYNANLAKIKKYYLDNRDKKKEYRKKYYTENYELEKKYYLDNRDKINSRMKDYFMRRKELDLNFKLACNLRSRTSSAFKSQNVRKTNKTFDLLGCSHSFFKNWIIHQLYGNMTVEKYGSVCQIDHCLPIVSFNLLDEIDMKKCLNWVNLRPMHSSENNSKNAKIDNRLYLMQEVKAKYFINLNAQEGLD